MTVTIPVTFRDQELDLPKCDATDHFMIMPGMTLTQNQALGVIHAMEGDETPEVQAAKAILSELAGPIPSTAGGPAFTRA